MTGRNGIRKLFEAGDDRLVSCYPLFIRKGERAHIISTGWDCNGSDEILVYRILHWPSNAKCEDALIAVWTQDVSCGDFSTVEIPRVKLTKANQHDIIDEHGQFLLVREKDARSVSVFAKYDCMP